jgi:NHL repeat-containing protein
VARTFAGTGKPGKADSPSTFDEPAGITSAAGKLYVADTNNHLIRVVDLKTRQVKTLEIAGLQPPAPQSNKAAANSTSTDGAVAAARRPTFRNAALVKLDAITVRPEGGTAKLKVNLQLPSGWHMNPQAPSVYLVEAATDHGPVDRQSIGNAVRLNEPRETFDIPLKLKASTGEDKLTVSLNYFYCQGGPEGVCKTGSVVWTVPIKLADETESPGGTLTFQVPGA